LYCVLVILKGAENREKRWMGEGEGGEVCVVRCGGFGGREKERGMMEGEGREVL